MTKMLTIYIDETDLWKDQKLYDVIVRRLHRNAIAGATVVAGFMGYGGDRKIHQRGLLGISDERPIIITAIDEEERLRRALPDITKIIKKGLVTLVDAETIPIGGSGDAARADDSDSESASH